MIPVHPPEMRPVLLVGEMNPYGADPYFALYPLPEHASGGRLASIIGLRHHDYLARHDRVNLCAGRWSLKDARARAQQLLDERRAFSQRRGKSGIVLLGAKVAQAFGFEKRVAIERQSVGCYEVLALPHPSGLCRAWNVDRVKAQARAAYGMLWTEVGS